MSWFRRERPTYDATSLVKVRGDRRYVMRWTLLGPPSSASGALAVIVDYVERGRFATDAGPIERVVRAVPVACWVLARTDYEVWQDLPSGRDKLIETTPGAQRVVGVVSNGLSSLTTIGRMLVAEAEPGFCGYASSREEVAALVRSEARTVLVDAALWRELDGAAALVREGPW